MVKIQTNDDGLIIGAQRDPSATDSDAELKQFSRIVVNATRQDSDGKLWYPVKLDIDTKGVILGWGINQQSPDWYPADLMEQIIPGYSKIIDGHVVTVTPNEEPNETEESKPSVESLQAQLAKLQEQISALTK